MPYPNEHSCRLRDPKDFKPNSFRRTERKHDGKVYSVIVGRLKGKNTMSEQAYRYARDKWDADAARSHCMSHNGTFEAAKSVHERSLPDDAMRERFGLIKGVDQDARTITGYAST